MPFGKFVKKTVRSGMRNVRKRYNIGKGKKGRLNIGRIAKDAAMIVRTLNAEKKIWAIGAGNQLATGQAVGQVNGNNSGTRVYDITPLLTQGVTAETRNGDSVKFTSAYFQFMVSQQTANVISNKLSIELWHYNGGSPISEADFLAATYAPTVFSTVTDYQSPRNIDRLGDMRLARKMVVSLDADQTNNSTSVRYINMPIKFNKGKGHHVRYVGSAIANNPLTDIVNGRSQLFLVYRAESGNRSNATASTLNVPITAINTGVFVQASYTMYFYDN
jgi:hypothetical protein